MAQFLTLAACASLLITTSNAQSATLSPVAQAAQASSVSQALNPSYAGFGIEPSNLFSFTGGSSPNQFSLNLIQNLAGYSGAPPHFRIGGNTADLWTYDSSYRGWDYGTNPNPTGQGLFKPNIWYIGPNYFATMDRLPKGTPITYGLNLPYDQSDYQAQLAKMAQAAIDNLKNVQLYSFEIGNEPDLYLQNQFRSAPWDGKTYTAQWLDRAAALYSSVLKPAGLPANFFEGPTTASTIGNTFEIPQLQMDGITGGSNGVSTYLAGWNQHDYFYFTGVTGFQLTIEYLSQLSNTEGQFAYWAKQIGIALTTGFPYYLREMASAGPTGIQGISDTHAASLWTLNFFLYCATLGVSSVQMHMTDNSWAAAWQPGRMHGVGQNVRPSYYAYAAMAQLIGSGNGTTQIAPITLTNPPSGYPDFVRAYSAYANGALSAIVVVNNKPSNSSVTNKPSLALKMNFPGSSGQTVYISTLTASGTEVISGASWNGLSFEGNGDGTPSTDPSNPVQTATVGSDGSVTLNVRDGSAIIANLGYQLGSRAVTVNGTAGSTGTAATGPRKTSTAASGTGSAATAAIAATTVAIVSSVSAGSFAATSASSSTPASAAALARPMNFGVSRSMFTVLAAVSVGVVALGAYGFRW